MKIKKLSIIFLFIFFLTGCDVNYNLELKDNKFNEKVEFILPNNYDTSSERNELLNSDLYINYNKKIKYAKEVIKKKDYWKFNYTYKYTFEEFKSYNHMNKCYEYNEFFEEENKYYIMTAPKFECKVYDYREADNVIISFKTNHKVIEHNADEVTKGVYKWIINDDNYQNKPIKLIISKDDIKRTIDFELLVSLSIILGIIITIGIIVIIYIYIVNRKNNKI